MKGVSAEETLIGVGWSNLDVILRATLGAYRLGYALEALRVNQGAIVVFQVAHSGDMITEVISDGKVECGSGVAEIEQN